MKTDSSFPQPSQQPDQHESNAEAIENLVRLEWGFLGILAAAAAYMCFLGVVALALFAFSVLTESGSADSVIMFGYGLLALGGVFALLMTTMIPFLTLLAMGFSWFVFYTLGATSNRSVISAFAGGLAGFVGTLLPFYGAIETDAWSGVIVGLLGPGVATLLGQLGGWLGASRPAPYRSPLLLSSANVAFKPNVEGNRSFRFGVGQLLVLTVWFAVAFTLLKLCGLLGPRSLAILLGWLVYQSGTMWCASRLVPWIRASSGGFL